MHASDARLKRDVVELEHATDQVLALRPVSFAWKKGDGRRHYGLIAQEVEQLAESLILENEEGYKGVAYMELVPLLVRALQEQEERIRRLEGGDGCGPRAGGNDASRGTVLQQPAPGAPRPQPTTTGQ